MDAPVPLTYSDVKQAFVRTLDDLSQFLKYQQSLGNEEFALSKETMAILDCWGTPGWRSHGFAGQGPDTAPLVIVDSEGGFFDGPAGKLLVKILKAMHLTPSQVYICNTGDMARVRSRILSGPPRCILTLGEKAGQFMLDRRDSLEKFRGNFLDFSGIPLMATLHPSALIENPALKRQVWEDVQQVMARAGL